MPRTFQQAKELLEDCIRIETHGEVYWMTKDGTQIANGFRDNGERVQIEDEPQNIFTGDQARELFTCGEKGALQGSRVVRCQ